MKTFPLLSVAIAFALSLLPLLPPDFAQIIVPEGENLARKASCEFELELIEIPPPKFIVPAKKPDTRTFPPLSTAMPSPLSEDAPPAETTQRFVPVGDVLEMKISVSPLTDLATPSMVAEPLK